MRGAMGPLHVAIFVAIMAIWGLNFVVAKIGYGAWYWLLRRYAVNQVMPFMLLMPVFGVASGIAFLDEPMTLSLIGGAALTILGVGIIIIRRPKLVAPEAERV